MAKVKALIAPHVRDPAPHEKQGEKYIDIGNVNLDFKKGFIYKGVTKSGRVRLIGRRKKIAKVTKGFDGGGFLLVHDNSAYGLRL